MYHEYRNKHKFKLFCLYLDSHPNVTIGWIAILGPLLIVAMGGLFDKMGVVDVGYGAHESCWIENFAWKVGSFNRNN